MNNFYLGADASKGYADFVILDSNKQVVKQNFQLDDTFEGHASLYEILATFFLLRWKAPVVMKITGCIS
jgi:transposase